MYIVCMYVSRHINHLFLCLCSSQQNFYERVLLMKQAGAHTETSCTHITKMYLNIFCDSLCSLNKIRNQMITSTGKDTDIVIKFQ